MKTLKSSALSFVMFLVATAGLMATSPAFADLPAQVKLEQRDNSTPAQSASAEPTKQEDTARYAKRQELAKTQANYQGGDGVIAISVTGTAILVLVLLIILL